MGDEIYIYIFIGIPLSLFLTYWFIHYASGAGVRKKQLQHQNRILLHIAKQQGVDIETIKEFEKINNEL